MILIASRDSTRASVDANGEPLSEGGRSGSQIRLNSALDHRPDVLGVSAAQWLAAP